MRMLFLKLITIPFVSWSFYDRFKNRFKEREVPFARRELFRRIVFGTFGITLFMFLPELFFLLPLLNYDPSDLTYQQIFTYFNIVVYALTGFILGERIYALAVKILSDRFPNLREPSKALKKVEYDELKDLRKDILISIKPEVRLNVTDLTKHVRIIGTTGGGKTKSVFASIIAQAIHNGQPVVVIDPKGDEELISAILSLMSEQGRVHDFLYFDVAKEMKTFSCTYNPLKNGNSRQIATRILATMQHSGGRYAYFEELQKELMNLMAELIGVLQTAYGNQPVNFIDLLSVLAYLPYSFHFLLDRIERLYPDKKLDARRLWIEAVMRRMNVEKRYKEFVAGLQQIITKYAYSFVAHAPALVNSYEPDIDFFDVYKHGKVAYFCLRALEYPGGESADFGKMILLDLQSLAGWKQRENVRSEYPMLVLVDEAQDVITREFLATLEKARSSGVGIILSHQTVDQFEEDINNIIESNTSTKIIMQLRSYETAEYYAKIVGQKIKYFMSAVEDRGNPYVERLRSYFPEVRASESEQYDYAVRPEFFLRLKVGQGVIILPDNSVYVSEALPYFAKKLSVPLRQVLPGRLTKEKELTWQSPVGLNIYRALKDRYGDASLLDKKTQEAMKELENIIEEPTRRQIGFVPVPQTESDEPQTIIKRINRAILSGKRNVLPA